MLQPGEAAYESQVVPGAKRVVIYDPRNPAAVLYEGDVSCPRCGSLYLIRGRAAAKPGAAALELSRAEAPLPSR